MICYKPKINLTLPIPKLSAIVILFVTLISVPIATNQSFATHLSEEMKWQLVFVASKGCSLYNYQMMNQYDEIAEKYLEMYSIENSKLDALCIQEDKYISEHQIPHDLDLIILVYDKELGERQLHAQKMGGLYTHTGSDRTFNHVIIICDCSNFYYSDPVWILSHDLSHFVLYYNNFEMSVIEDLIHANDLQYDLCIDGGFNCDSFVTKLGIDSSTRLFSVMPIYEPDKIPKTEKTTKDDEIRNTVIGLTKMITKWWAGGKISDGDYSNAIGYLVDSKYISSDTNSGILIADDPIDDSVTWEEKFSEINSALRDGSSPQDNQPTDVSDFISKYSAEQLVLGLPDWFKQTAGWWAQDRISDEEFKSNIGYLINAGIIRGHAPDVLYSAINVNDSLIDLSIEKITKKIESLIDSYTIDYQEGQKLMNKIEKAQRNFDFEKKDIACKNLDDFVESTSEYIDEQKIPIDKGQDMINSADIVKLNFC